MHRRIQVSHCRSDLCSNWLVRQPSHTQEGMASRFSREVGKHQESFAQLFFASSALSGHFENMDEHDPWRLNQSPGLMLYLLAGPLATERNRSTHCRAGCISRIQTTQGLLHNDSLSRDICRKQLELAILKVAFIDTCE